MLEQNQPKESRHSTATKPQATNTKNKARTFCIPSCSNKYTNLSGHYKLLSCLKMMPIHQVALFRVHSEEDMNVILEKYSTLRVDCKRVCSSKTSIVNRHTNPLLHRMARHISKNSLLEKQNLLHKTVATTWLSK